MSKSVKGVMIKASDYSYTIASDKLKSGFPIDLFDIVNWVAFYQNDYVLFMIPSGGEGKAVFIQHTGEEMLLPFLYVSNPEKAYIGLKDYDFLVSFGHDTKKIIRFGIFGERLLIWMKFVSTYIPNWGFIIILIALIIVLGLFTFKFRLVFIKPSITSFDIIKRSMNIKYSLIAILISGSFSGLLLREATGEMGLVYMIQGAILCAMLFFIGQTLLWGFSKLFGGKGSIIQQINLFAAFSAPLVTVYIMLLGIIPDIGIFIIFLLGVYQIILSFIGLRATHNYSTKKAVLTLLGYFIVLPILLGLTNMIWQI